MESQEHAAETLYCIIFIEQRMKMVMMPFTNGAVLCLIAKPKLDCNEIRKSFMTLIMEQLGNKIAGEIRC